MAEELEQFMYNAVVIGETTRGNKDRTKSYVVSSQKGAFRSTKNACIAVGVFDDNGKMIGVDVTGSPSEAMRRLMDLEFSDEEPPGVASA